MHGATLLLSHKSIKRAAHVEAEVNVTTPPTFLQQYLLDILVQSRRNTRAATRFMRKLVKQYGEPRVLIADKLCSYGAAKRQLIPCVKHRSHKALNNKAEVSHRQTRRSVKIFGRFK